MYPSQVARRAVMTFASVNIRTRRTPNDQRFVVAISRIHGLIALPSATAVSRLRFVTTKQSGLDSDVGDGP
jgi:hypothetical protein